MSRSWAKPIFFLCLILFTAALCWPTPVVRADSPAQIATGSIPTVTSTSSGPMAVVMPVGESQANLRAGPNVLFDKVGVLLVGQSAPAKGRSAGNEWVLIEYPGAPGGEAWIYAAYVDIRPPSTLPIIEPPPTPTPAVVATLDPTLAARWLTTQEPTRLPTFTAPPPLVVPTYTVDAGPSLGGVPMGFLILGLAVLGLFFGIVAFSQR